MQKIKLHACLGALVLGAASFGALAQARTPAPESSGVKSSIKTVDELLKIENAELLGSRTPWPPEGAPVFSAPAPVAPFFFVTSLYGTASALKADMTANGEEHEALRVGSTIAGCRVVEIVGQCVVLAPNKKRTPASFCKRVCWTGLPTASSQPLSGGDFSSSMQMQGRPMPAPLPMGAIR